MLLRVFYPFTGPGRNRPAGRDDTARSDGSPASYLKVHHASRLPQRRTKSRLDNNGTQRETVEKSRAGIPELTAPGIFSRRLCSERQFPDNALQFCRQLPHRRFVCRCKCSHNNVHASQDWKNPGASNLTQASSQEISLNNPVSMLCNNYSHSSMRKQGVGSPNIQMLGTYPSPCLFH